MESRMAGGLYFRGRAEDFKNLDPVERNYRAIMWNHDLYVRTLEKMGKAPDSGCICCGLPSCIAGCAGFDPAVHPHIVSQWELIKKD
jgi:hypothetical protein